MKVRFTNHSVSGTYRQYGEFTLDIPGQRNDKPAVVETDVPDNLVEDVTGYLKAMHPAIAVDFPSEDEGLDEAEAERLAAEAEAAAAAAVEAEKLAAEAAEKVSKGKGGSRK